MVAILAMDIADRLQTDSRMKEKTKLEAVIIAAITSSVILSIIMYALVNSGEGCENELVVKHENRIVYVYCKDDDKSTVITLTDEYVWNCFRQCYIEK